MDSAIDPISILILVAANGYACDIVVCSSLSRDPDLQSYLVKSEGAARCRLPCMQRSRAAT